jgi:two-component system CheB/CheR fusion protein
MQVPEDEEVRHSEESSPAASNTSDPDDQGRFVSDQDISPARGQPFVIVGIGGSAGGLQAFTEFLRALPVDTGMAYVFVQHLEPHHESQLTEILSRATTIPVSTITDGLKVHPNEIYVMPPNVSVVLEDGTLRLRPRGPGLHLPIDIFFESLARAQGGRAVGIVLSGNASDGSCGVRAIKGECGLTFAQDEVSARHSGMPRNATSTGAIDFVLPPEEIAHELARLSRHPYVATPSQGQVREILPDGDGELRAIFNQLLHVTKVDFSQYKTNTVRRRIGRRMIVNRSKSMAEYARHLKENRSEVQSLFRDLLISVTSFFRDPGTFTALTELISDRLSETTPTKPFRVWVPGCATGEEVYSHAISIQELIENLNLSTSFQIFGTDINEAALEKARAGLYSEAIKNDIAPERLSRFFVRDDGGFRISKALRENCIFARQDVTADSPFAHTDLISCRNVLIYMHSGLQKRVLPIFHYSLNSDGFLLLGSAETIGAAPDLFAVVDKEHHIYAPKAVPARIHHLLRQRALSTTEPSEQQDRLTGIDLAKKADRILQSQYSPAAVVVDQDLQIFQFRGPTSQYLDPSPGDASLNLLRMAGESLLYPLRHGIETASTSGTPVAQKGVKTERHGKIRKIDIDVVPIQGTLPGERYFLIVFQDSHTPEVQLRTLPSVAVEELPADLDARTQELQKQLAETREYLRNLTEEYEAHSEELRAANEEVRSANEELQSTNEELSTTKEELQSANEELTTVNEELQNRNEQLNTVNNDLNNLLTAVSIAIVMVDSSLRVRRFNTAAQKLLELESVDIGRPITHPHGRLEVPQLGTLIRTVLETLNVVQSEVQDKTGHWYSVSIRPYRTADNRIEGAVIVYLDIDPLKRSLQAAEQARDFAEDMIETVREPLVVLDADLRIQRATSAFYETFQVSSEETVGRLLYDLGNGQWNHPRLRELLGNALYRDQPFQDFEVEHEFPHIGKRTFRLTGRRIPRLDPSRRRVLLSIQDVTTRREEAELRYHRLFEAAKDGIIEIDFETGKVTDVNPYWLNMTGFPREEFVGKLLHQTTPFSLKDFSHLIPDLQTKEAIREDEFPLLNARGQRFDVDMLANRYFIGSRQVVQVNVRDISHRKAAAERLRRSEEQFRMLVDSVHDYALFQMDLNGNITSWNAGAERVLGYTEQEILGEPGRILFTPEDVAAGEAEKELETARREGRAEDERWHVRRNGSRFFASGVLTTVRDDEGRLRGFAKVMRDITERKQAEIQNQISLREKEVLLKEIHHRVKNNLQMIVSLISLQSSHLQDPAAIRILDEMHSRVRSIASIHDMLYCSVDLSSIDFSAYLRNIIDNMSRFYDLRPGQIRLHVSAEETSLDLSRAIPCGLIVNELLTNALKHAFPGDRRGDVRITFRCAEGRCVLEVADNGIGLRSDVNPGEATSMGLQLVALLVEQLDAKLDVDRANGTRFLISFPIRTPG